VAVRKLHFLRYARLKTRYFGNAQYKHLRLVNSSFSDVACLENEAFFQATCKNYVVFLQGLNNSQGTLILIFLIIFVSAWNIQ
jgi:hypothetical protein